MSSTGLIANPDAITAYGKVVGQQAAALSRVNSALAGAHLPADAFGKLPEAGDLYNAYMSHADDVRALTSALPGQLDKVADGIHANGAYYASLESAMADGIRSVFGLPGTAGTSSLTGTAIGDTSGIVSQTMSAYDWVTDPEDSLPNLAVSNFYGAEKGLSGLLDKGIDWVIQHVPELPKLLDDVTGDTDALKSAAAVWHDQGTALLGVVTELKASARNLPEEWAGSASEAFGRFMGDVVSSFSSMASEMGQVQQILEDAAAEAEFAHDTIVMIIREVVEWVAGNILIDAVTLGIADILSAPATAAFLGKKVQQAEQAASKLAGVYKALKTIVDALHGLKAGQKGIDSAEGFNKLKKFYTFGKDFEEKALDLGKLRNLRFGDGKLASAAKMVFGAGVRDKSLTVHEMNELREQVETIKDLGHGGVLSMGAIRTAMVGGPEIAGVSAEPDLSALGKRLIEGNLENGSDNSMGAAEALGLGTPSIPEAPPINRIDALLKGLTPPEEH